MQPLSPVDQIFLWLEKRQQPMHVGGLHIFSCPDGASPKYITEMADFMRTFESPSSPFNRRLRLKFGQYYWEEDQQFDLEHHFRHVALPKPGRIRELLGVVSANHSHLMDRERPMWGVHLIEGLRGKRFAFYVKAHHCMLDGVAAMRLVEKIYCPDSTRTEMPPFWSLPVKKRDKPSLESGDIVHSIAIS
jgi:diacylglycerol O-acyltransferase